MILFCLVGIGAFGSEEIPEWITSDDRSTSKFVAFMHINANCSDFDRSHKFYQKLGFEIVSIPFMGPLKVEDKVDAEFAKGLDLPPYEITAAPMKSKFDGSMIDLIRFKDPYDGNLPYAKVNHLGIVMITIETTDLDADIKLLKEQGIQFLSEPQEYEKTSVKHRFTALKDPDGNVIQLLENKNAKPGKWYYGKKLKFTRFLYVTVNVSSLAQSCDFYKMVGFTQTEEATIIGTIETGQALGLSEAFKTQTALMKMNNGPGVLLQQWDQPNFDPELPYEKLNHIGFARFAIETSDIQSDYQRLLSQGIKFYAEPKKPQGKLAFITFACFEDPDGTVLEAAYSSAPKFPGF